MDQFIPGGPADPKAPVAQKGYSILTALLGLVGVASTFGLVTGEQAANFGDVATAATTLLGAVGTLVASFRTKKQIKNGTFTEAPALPSVSALEQLKILRDQAAHEVERGVQAATAGAAVIQDVVAKASQAAQAVLPAPTDVPAPELAPAASVDLLAAFR